MTINPEKFFNEITGHGVDFFTGVPDSLLKEFCFCVDERMPMNKHIIAANEGNAIAIATGHYLAKKSIPLVYMQNSGIGNALNPLLSLCDPDVYSIPMLVMIGWRGEPGVKDEPQHIKQGKVQLKLLESLDIPYEIISKDDDQFGKKISITIETATNENRPAVLLIKKGTFQKYKKEIRKADDQHMKRVEALEIILKNVDSNVIVVSTTGKTSREIFEIRENRGESHQQDFLTVGSMGHCSSIALGIAIEKPDRKVVCIDGDGALIMHMGSLSTVGKLNPKNFYHILINNQVHESVGGQATSVKSIDITKLVKANGYKCVSTVWERSQLINEFKEYLVNEGPAFLEVKIVPGSKKSLGRPTIKPIDNKKAFMDFLRD